MFGMNNICLNLVLSLHGKLLKSVSIPFKRKLQYNICTSADLFWKDVYMYASPFCMRSHQKTTSITLGQ